MGDTHNAASNLEVDGSSQVGRSYQAARDIHIHERPPNVPRRELRVFGDPPNVVPNFVNRQDLLNAVGSSDETIVTAIHGIGGVGKSQLAAEFFRKNHADYDFAAWIDMRRQRGHTDYARLAGYLGLPAFGGDLVEVVRSYLKGTTERWLVVFDNAEGPQDVEPLRPDNPSHVKTIVTSRHRHWSGYANASVQVDTFTLNQAAEYIRALANRPSDPDANALANALGCLPLAIKFAGNYCLTQSISFGEYTSEYLPFHLDPTNPDSSDHAIHHLWQQSLEAVTAETDSAASVACLIAAIDWSNISRRWFVEHHPDPTPTITRTLGLLSSASLIELNDTTIKIPHNLIATGLRHYAKFDDLSATLRELFENTTPTPDDASGDLESVDRFGEAVRHLEHLTLTQPHLISESLIVELNQAVSQQRHQGQQTPDFPEEVEQIVVDLLGPNHPAALTSRHHLANCYSNIGRSHEAMTLYEQNLRDSKRVLGPDHLNTLHSRHRLANCYANVGRHEEAIALHQHDLTDRERILGPDHPHTLDSRNTLANIYLYLGRHQEAIALHQQNLTDRERILGPDHPDTLHSHHNLANCYANVGRHQEAIALHQQNLTDRERILGPDHPDTLHSCHGLASGFASLGNSRKALTLHKKNLTARTHILGPRHLDTVETRRSLNLDD